MRSATLLIFLFTISSLVFSQNEAVPGYYINTKGDTIQGKFPKFKTGVRNPGEVLFISNDNKEILLTQKNCHSFVAGDYERYDAYEGLRMTNPIEESRLGVETLPDAYDSIHTFLKIIYQNKNVILYSYKDKIRENFFYEKNDKEIVELKKKLYVYYSGEQKFSSSTNEFRDQLKQQFPEQIEARQLQSSLNKLAFTEKDLVNFMDLLNETKTAQKKDKHPTKLFIGVGAAFNSLDIAGNESYLETQVNHSSPISPVFTIGAQFYASRNGRILITPRVSVYSFRASGTVNLTSGATEYSHESSFEANLIVKPSATLGYNIINHADLKWHASVGAGFAFLLDSKETQTTHYPASSKVLEYKPNAMVFVFALETGVDIGKNIGIWINYQPPANTSDLVNKTAKISSAQVGINWLFKAGK